MRDRYDDGGGWTAVLANFIVFLVMLVIAGSIVTGVVALTIHSDHVSCLRLHEQTNLPTKYARSGGNGECYVQVHDGTWVPQENWVSTKEAW